MGQKNSFHLRFFIGVYTNRWTRTTEVDLLFGGLFFMKTSYQFRIFKKRLDTKHQQNSQNPESFHVELKDKSNGAKYKSANNSYEV